MKSWNEIRKAATAFSKRWKTAYDEKCQTQSFLKEFFELFGVDAPDIYIESRPAPLCDVPRPSIPTLKSTIDLSVGIRRLVSHRGSRRF